MGLFDDYFDPQQFQDGQGLLGRLLSLQLQQGQYQPGHGFDGQPGIGAPNAPDVVIAPPTSVPMPMPRPAAAGSQAAQPPPDLGDRLGAGFQSWALTPVGNPMAAFANGIAGFSSGHHSDVVGVAPAQTQAPTQPPGLGDRLSVGFQNWARTPVGNPITALASGITGFGSGQRIADPANPPQDLRSRYEALRSLLGDQGAMVAAVNPQVGNTMVAQALTGVRGNNPTGLPRKTKTNRWSIK